MEFSNRNFKKKGAKIVEISLPHTQYALSTYYIIATAEASSNLARYDGLRYGHRSEKGETVESLYTNSRDEGFGEEVKRRILMGTFVLQESAYKDYYRKALQIRRLIQNDYNSAFKEVDIIITPTSSRDSPPLISEKMDPVETYVTDIMTTPANLAGIPAISVPIIKEKNNFSQNIQLMAQHWNDEMLLKIAQYIEHHEH